VLARSTAWVFAHGDHTPNAEQAQRLEHLLQRRIEGEPLAYLLGRREFYGRDFGVTPSVLIPRPETELLVETVLDRGPAGPARIVDVGTGSGCIALTLALERPDWQVLATDLSAAALAVAQGNGQQLGGTVEWIETDLLAGVPGPFHVIVSNPPYVAAGDPHLSRGDLRFEPMTALTDEGDGLVLIRRLIEQARQRQSKAFATRLRAFWRGTFVSRDKSTQKRFSNAGRWRGGRPHGAGAPKLERCFRLSGALWVRGCRRGLLGV
jgi:release factor glutamine methyltransferase